MKVPEEFDSEMVFQLIYNAYKRGIEFVCELEGVGGDRLAEIRGLSQKAAYDYADKTINLQNMHG